MSFFLQIARIAGGRTHAAVGKAPDEMRSDDVMKQQGVGTGNEAIATARWENEGGRLMRHYSQRFVCAIQTTTPRSGTTRANDTLKEITMQAHTGPLTETLDGSETKTRSAVVAVYDTHLEAEEAVRDLQGSGFDMKKLSIVGKDYQTEEGVVGYYTTGDRMKAWGRTGAFWGGLWGLLFGSAFFFIPGIGPLLAAGPLVGWVVGALEGAVVVGGMSALGAGLYSIGIPKDSVLEYETLIKAGKFVVITHGLPDEVSKTKSTLAATKHQGMNEHACCTNETVQGGGHGETIPSIKEEHGDRFRVI